VNLAPSASTTARVGSQGDQLLVELGEDGALTCDDLDTEAVRADAMMR
jgi:hypothetical protein